jgi:hypothetical protein
LDLAPQSKSLLELELQVLRLSVQPFLQQPHPHQRSFLQISLAVGSALPRFFACFLLKRPCPSFTFEHGSLLRDISGDVLHLSKTTLILERHHPRPRPQVSLTLQTLFASLKKMQIAYLVNMPFE